MKLVRLMITGVVSMLAVACAIDPGGENYEEDRVGSGDFELSAPLSEKEISSLPTLAMEQGPNASAAAASCWVTLNYCRHPTSGKSTCTATAGCTRPAAICASLIDDICGNLDIGGVSCSRMSSGSRWTCVSSR